MTIEAEGPDEELLRARDHVLAVRPRHRRRRSAGSTTSSASGRSSPRRTSGPSRPATRSARRPRSSTPTTASRRPSCRRARTATSPATRRPRSGFAGRVEARRPAAVLRLLPDHAGVGHPPPAVGLQELRRQDVPGRGRDRGDRRGDRRELRRRDGPDGVVRARASRSSPRRSGLAVMVELPLVVIDVQRAGPSTGHADEDRAGRPAPGDVRAQQRLADRRSSPRRRPASASTSRSRRGGSP